VKPAYNGNSKDNVIFTLQTSSHLAQEFKKNEVTLS